MDNGTPITSPTPSSHRCVAPGQAPKTPAEEAWTKDSTVRSNPVHKARSHTYAGRDPSSDSWSSFPCQQTPHSLKFKKQQQQQQEVKLNPAQDDVFSLQHSPQPSRKEPGLESVPSTSGLGPCCSQATWACGENGRGMVLM